MNACCPATCSLVTTPGPTTQHPHIEATKAWSDHVADAHGQQCLALVAMDHACDGWDGAELGIYDPNGAREFLSQGPPAGTCGEWVEAVCIPDGCHSLTVVDGSYPDEAGRRGEIMES